jgi:hypothetical protein
LIELLTARRNGAIDRDGEPISGPVAASAALFGAHYLASEVTEPR